MLWTLNPKEKKVQKAWTLPKISHAYESEVYYIIYTLYKYLTNDKLNKYTVCACANKT